MDVPVPIAYHSRMANNPGSLLDAVLAVRRENELERSKQEAEPAGEIESDTSSPIEAEPEV